MTENTEIHAEQLLTSHQVGAILQANPSSVKKWISEGRLIAFRTPGGHRRIRAADLVQFIDAYKMPIPRRLSDASRRRLLVVDDDTAHLRALNRALKKYSTRIEVSLIANGIDALVRVGAFRPHLVVLDVVMPTVNGLEVCQRLKANPETSSIEVILASGQFTAELEAAALAAGALRCMPKPIDLKLVFEDLGIGLQPAF
ncbi:MAG: response regulator [Myxococcales bacterium]|nr:response regulator [Myxococcales bacterium]